ncbi:MAG: signal recognition particle-docking protein FtsY [Verrucomicrobiales bacterium]|nr:signal recognition particle-docking protein FtsY [Verrucomicrobiales bacterium]|tara:strand:- start:8323 stop:9237 length:915 start_codon:yes stop_codon:yes gene_type:complete
MGLFSKFREGLRKSTSKLGHEIKRVVSGSSRLTADSVEELEYILLSSDIGLAMTQQILAAVREAYETQGSDADVIGVATEEVTKSFESEESPLAKQLEGLTVVSMVGVNGTGKTTTTAKLAHRLHSEGQTVLMAACDTFRAAAIDQLKLWGERLNADVIAGEYGADPAAVAHDGISAATARNADYLIVDTAGRLHTKSNLMKELQKVHRVMDKQLEGAPHECLLVIDATTGMNAAVQAREFNKHVPLTGLVVTKLDGTSKGGMVVGIHKELKLPIKFVGLGEQPDDLQPFNAKQFAEALFSTDE